MSALTRVRDFLTFRDLPANRPPQIRALPTVPEYQKGRAVWYDHNPAVYVEDGYNRVVVAYRCVNIIANALASAPLRVYQDHGAGQLEVVDPGPGSSTGRLATLVRDPNPYMSQTETLGIIAKIALSTGFCVYEKERGPLGQVTAIYPLRSDWLRSVPRESGVYDWEYWVPGYRQPFRLEAEDVGVFTAEPSPSLSPFGVAPLSAALREVAIENQMTDFVKVFFQNNAVPSFVAILKDDYANVNDDEAAVYAEKMRQKFGDGRGAGAVGIMPALERIERVGFDFDEMAYPELRALTSTQICTAFGVPPILIGIQAGLDASTYSNYEQARRAFYEDTITPLWGRLDGSLTRALLPDYAVDGNVSLEFDTSEIPALQDDLTSEREQHIKLWQAQVITRNELRASFGFAEIEDELGAEFYAPVNPFVLPQVDAPESDEDDEARSWAGMRVIEAPQSWRPGVEAIKDAWSRVPFEPPALPSPNGHHRMERLPPDTRAAVATTARDAYDALMRAGAPALRRFWKQQGERVVRAATRVHDGTIEKRYNIDMLVQEDWRIEYVAAMDGFGEFRDIAAIDWDEEADLLAEVLDAIHKKATRQGWLSARNQGIPPSAYDIANPYVQTVLDEVATRITGINQTTMNDVRRVVGDSLDQGVTMDELAANLKGLFTETYKSRSLTVARTESQVAYNLGTVAAGKDSGVSSYAELMDNPEHDTDPGSDGLTCAQRNGLIVPLDGVPIHIAAEHPNGTLAVALVVDAIKE